MQHRVKSWSLISVLLTGCMYHHPYHPPQVPVSNRWTVQDRQITVKDDTHLPYLAWWRGFHDPTLNRLIDRGLVSNNTLNMSRAHIEAAEGELKKIHYQWIPDLDLLMGYSRNPATGFPGFVVALIPSYTLNVFKQLKEERRAKYELARVKAEDDAVKLAIISEIAATYFTYQAEKEREQLLQILANDLTRIARISEKIYKDGLSSNIDPQALYSEVNLIHGQQEIIQQNIVISRNALRYLINENPGDIKTNRTFLHFKNKHLMPGSLPLTVLENRPDMKMAENRLRASSEGIGIAVSQLLPSIHLDMITGLTSGNSQYTIPVEPIYFNDQLVTAPLLKFSALGEIAKARGLDKVSYYHYIDTLQKALRDTTNALANNEHLNNKLQQTIHAQQRLAKAYDLNWRLYQRGIENYLETLKNKIVLDKINIDVNQDKLQQLISMVRLYEELAGGYKEGQDEINRPKFSLKKRG